MTARKRQAGFTLVELMVVVAIIGILAAIGIPSMKKFIYTAQTSEAVEMAGRIAKGIQGYEGSQMKTPGELATSLDGKVLSSTAASNTLSALIPTLTISSDAKFDYTIGVITGAPDTTRVTFCIKATGIANKALSTGYVLFSASATKVDGWENNVNRVNFMNTSDNPVAGGNCTAAGGAVATAA